MQQSMSQTISCNRAQYKQNIRQRVAEGNDKHKMMPRSIGVCNYMSECKPNTLDEVHNSLFQRLFDVSLAVTLEKMKYSEGRADIDEVLRGLHHDEFNLGVFKEVVKFSRDCEIITQDAINNKKRA